MVCNLGHITEYLLLREYSWWVSVLRLYWSAGDFKPGFSQHHNKAWAPLALQPGAGAPTLPSFLLFLHFPSLGDAEQFIQTPHGLVIPCESTQQNFPGCGLSALVLIPLILCWEYPQHHYMEFLSWPLNLLQTIGEMLFTKKCNEITLHREIFPLYKNKLEGRSCVKPSSGNHSLCGLQLP